MQPVGDVLVWSGVEAGEAGRQGFHKFTGVFGCETL